MHLLSISMAIFVICKFKAILDPILDFLMINLVLVAPLLLFFLMWSTLSLE